jgi:hypothetical protein
VSYARAFRLQRCASRCRTRTAPICCYLQWVTTRACYLQEQNRELVDIESGITSMPTRIDANTQSAQFRQEAEASGSDNWKGWGRRQPRTTAGHSEDHGRRTPCRGERRPREKREEEDGYGSHVGTGNRERQTPDRWDPPVGTDEIFWQKRSLL